MSKKIIITSQLVLLLFISTFSQSDTTVCIDFNPDLNQKIRKNIISLNILPDRGTIREYQLELGYERIIKENKTISASFGGGSGYNIYRSFHYNLAYRLYFSNMKYARIKINKNKYHLRKQQHTMQSPKGLYVGPMTHFNISKGYDQFFKSINAGLGVHLGYQFLFFNRIALNTSLQLPLTFEGDFYRNYDLDHYEFSEYYTLRPRLFLNLNLGIAF